MSPKSRPYAGRHLAVVVVCLLSGAIASEAVAATITVNDLSDYAFNAGPSNNTSVDPTGCTLRKAITNANNNAQTFTACAAGSGTSNAIVFSAGSGTISLGTYGSPLNVNRTLSISGGITIDGGNHGDIFRVASSNVELSLNGLTLKRGSNSAVSIQSSGSSLVANGCRFEDNSNPGAGGGAISSAGTVHINACYFEGNTANGSGDGGGAIRLAGSSASTISNSFFLNNSAKTSGGAVRYNGSGSLAALTISNTLFGYNSAKADDGKAQGGGAIWHQQGLLTIQNSTFAYNQVDGEGRGGALHLALGSPVALLQNNLFTLNQAKGNGGLGGAIFSSRAAIIDGNTFIDNSAATGHGGAVAANAPLKGGLNTTSPGLLLANSTLHDNRAKRGGAIYNMGPESGSVERGITLVNVTIDGNKATDPNGGGGIYSTEPQAGKKPEADVRNSILSNNTSNGVADNCNSNPVVPILNFGGSGNLLWPASSCAATPAFSAAQVGNPKLAAPAPGLVPTLTMAPQAGSFALQAGTPSVCSGFPIFNLDQRLATRPNPSGSACDAGAHESSLGPPSATLDVTPSGGIAFGQVPVNGSVQLVATVTNSGTLALEGLAVATSGARFSIASSTCASVLAPAASCTVNIAFAPIATGAASGTFSATGNGGLSGMLTLAGSGFEADPQFVVAPASGLAFGNQAVGSSSSFLEATISNNGNVALSGLTITAGTPFATVAGGSCSGSLAIGASCTQRVVFTPVAAGPASATLLVGSSEGASNSVVLSGTGTVPASLVIGPAQGLDFGTHALGSSSDRLVAVLSNPGTQTATNLTFTTPGSLFPFVVDDTTCGSQLPGGQQCSIDLRFSPGFTGPVTRNFGAMAMGISFVTIVLSGDGINPPQLSVTPVAGIDFGKVQTGTTFSWLPAQVNNPGGEPLANLQVSVSPPFGLILDNCSGNSLPAGGSCAMRVTASPTLDGVAIGSLAATAADGFAGQISLRVEGFTPGSLVLQPAGGLQFGSVPVGASATPQSAVLVNPGSETIAGLAIGSIARFPILGNDCGSTLAGGASCGLLIGFEPDSAATFATSVIASGLRPGGQQVLASLPAAGSGYSQTPRLRLTPAQGIDFGAVELGNASAQSQIATLTNISGIAVSFSLATSDNNFAILENTCASPLAGGASCNIALRFTPIGLAGARNGYLEASVGGFLERITLSGRAIAIGSPAFASSPGRPGPLAFAARMGEAASRSVTISNTGTASLLVGQPQLGGGQPGDFTIASEMPLVIAPGASKAMVLICEPTRAGSRSALLTLQTNDPATPSASFGLNCEGIAPLFVDGFEAEPTG
jgi:hypothetical protein